MGRTSREEVVAQILDATARCVYETGVESVQMTQIAAKAGISCRTLNRYYSKKDLLLSDAASKYLWRVYQSFIEDYKQMPKDGINGFSQLRLFLNMLRDYYKTDSAELELFVKARIYCVRHGVGENSWAAVGGRELRQIVAGTIDKGIRDGSILDRGDSQLVTSMLLSSYNGIMLRLAFIYRSESLQEKRGEIFRVFDSYMDMLNAYLRA